jgi:Tfp pilus assembly protein PilF
MTLLLAALLAQAEEAEKVYAAVSPSVVSLENVEGGGTGFFIDDKGLILTNAHVVASPLPFQVKAEVLKGKEKQSLVFKRVEIVGVHPKYDLALARVDPKEHGVKLPPVKLAKVKPGPGRRVYAIGNPAAGGAILSKTITEGMLSAVDRVVDGLAYHQISAPVNPGNSGGPVCDKKGEVLGIVTFKYEEVEGIGFAIPLHEFRADVFVPLKQRGADPAKAKECVQAAEKFAAKADEAARQFGLDDPRRHVNNYLACLCFRMALTFDPGNADLYYNVGMLWRTLDEDRVAAAYLARAATLQPWHDPRGQVYRELGYSLVKQDRKREARVAWSEGLAKYPVLGGKIYEDLAIFHYNEKEYVEAAACAALGLKVGDVREEVMRDLYRNALRAMAPEDQKKLTERERAIDTEIAAREAASKSARKAGKSSMTREFEEFLANFDGVQREAPASSAWKKPDAAPPADDEAARWIRARIQMARNFHDNGMRDKAIEKLQEVVKKYPDRPETKEARELIEQWKK